MQERFPTLLIAIFPPQEPFQTLSTSSCTGTRPLDSLFVASCTGTRPFDSLFVASCTRTSRRIRMPITRAPGTSGHGEPASVTASVETSFAHGTRVVLRHDRGRPPPVLPVRDRLLGFHSAHRAPPLLEPVAKRALSARRPRHPRARRTLGRAARQRPGRPTATH